MHPFRSLAVLACVVAVAAAASIVTSAYSSFGSWGTGPAVMYINPQNADVSATAAETAIRTAMGVWNSQGGTPFQFQFGGRVSDTSTGHDGKSVILFRNVANGSTLGTSYAWSVNGKLVESDVIFWDGGYKFFTGTSGCSSGMYIEDVAVHELGHSAGLGHSQDSGASMYPRASAYCSQSWRTLASDDIAGLKSLYGSASPATNTAPSVSIIAPVSGSSFAEGTTISFAGSATDSQDGNLSSRLSWTSSVDGKIGSGSAFSRTLRAGTHTIRASVTDNGGLTTMKEIVVAVTSSTATAPKETSTGTRVLSARTALKNGYHRVYLSWSGFTSAKVSLYRNGVEVARTENDGSYIYNIKATGSATYLFKLCELQSTTCSNEVTATF